MPLLTTGPITHDQYFEETVFLQGVLKDAGVRTVLVCCAAGVHVSNPLFARDVPVEVDRLTDYFRDHEAAGSFRFGQTNITLQTDLEAVKFWFGNDNDIFCEGDESPTLRLVCQRWVDRYPYGG